MVKIAQIESGSIAEELELEIGTRIVRINGQPVRDGIDLTFFLAEPELEMETVAPDGVSVIYEITRAPGEPLGLAPAPDKIRECSNRCVFCFIDGNPPGVRESLDLKDDDFRLSFTYGSYVTLTNLGPRGLKRLVEQRISPLYVSVHATEPELRVRLLEHPRAGQILEHLRYFAEHELEVHTQVVLCPGWNDGPHLDRTIDDLWDVGEAVRTLTVVPVGLTRYNLDRPVRLLTKGEASTALAQVERARARAQLERGLGWCYGADELFLIGGERLPTEDYYDDHSLLENGVGALRRFLSDFERGLPRVPSLPGRRIRIVTGTSMAPFLVERGRPPFRTDGRRSRGAPRTQPLLRRNRHCGRASRGRGRAGCAGSRAPAGSGSPSGGEPQCGRALYRQLAPPGAGQLGGPRPGSERTRGHRRSALPLTSTMSASLPVVAVVGRPNVGKSTLFNRVVGRRQAIVHDQPGVTRDRNFARADWAGRQFFIVDTGGVIEGSTERLHKAVRQQALAAAEEADLIVFLVDGKDGLHPLDERLAELLRGARPPVLLVVNKMDNLPNEMGHHDFWRLGLGDPIPVSSNSGKGSGDLLDLIVNTFPVRADADEDTDVVRVAVVGKPNVGKSSFVNRLLGEERMVVSEEAGTTRDPVDTPLRYHGKTLVFVDTAGLRRQSRIKESLEYYSALRTARVVQNADVCIVLADGTEPLHLQDIKVAEQAWEAGAGLIMAINKWDLVEKDTMSAARFQKEMRRRTRFLQWVPTLFISALTGQRVRKTLDLVLQVQAERQRRVDTHEVNEVLGQLIGRQPPPHSRGRPVKIRYGTQVAVAPPTFALFANFPRAIPEHYIRYIHNGFRERWGFNGVPLRIRLRPSKRESPGS